MFPSFEIGHYWSIFLSLLLSFLVLLVFVSYYVIPKISHIIGKRDEKIEGLIEEAERNIAQSSQDMSDAEMILQNSLAELSKRSQMLETDLKNYKEDLVKRNAADLLDYNADLHNHVLHNLHNLRYTIKTELKEQILRNISLISEAPVTKLLDNEISLRIEQKLSNLIGYKE